MSLSDTPRAERHKEFLTNCHYAQSRPGALLNSYKIHSNFTETFEDIRSLNSLSHILSGFLVPLWLRAYDDPRTQVVETSETIKLYMVLVIWYVAVLRRIHILARDNERMAAFYFAF